MTNRRKFGIIRENGGDVVKARYVDKYMPDQCCKSIFEIDFEQLKMYKALFFDLDNTLAEYVEKYASPKIISLFKELKALGFKLYIISNNKHKRVAEFAKHLNLDGFLAKANKPITKRVLTFIAHENLQANEIIGIGDQILTDIAFYKKAKIYSILVKTINCHNQKWYTKINRLREKRIIKKIKSENYERGVKLAEICQDV